MLQLDNLSHFVTKRFDRIANKKIHMLSLSAITESDPDNQRSFDYDLLLRITKNICLDYKSVEDQFRRMIFNLLSVNQDDHTRNFSFLMGENNKWQLSPAYDLSFAHSGWCSEHQLLFNGKLGSEVTFHDLEKIGRNHGIKNTKDIIDQVIDGVETFYQLAHKNGVPEDKIHIINQALQNREASVTLKGNVKLKQVQKENQLDAPQVDSLNQSVTTLIPKYER
jgi:serine/threonine-protein kinase HipA